MGLRGPKSNKSLATKRDIVDTTYDGMTRADAVVKFFSKLRITAGLLQGDTFDLRAWEEQIIRAWYALDADNNAIVRTGLLTVGRKNGKSAICAGLGLCHLLGPTQEKRGEIVIGAKDRDQSGVIFRECIAMIQEDPDMLARVNIKRHEKTIEDLVNGSRLVALSSDAKKAHGLSPSVVIMDELAQWGDGTGRGLYDALITGHGARKQPLTIIIGTQAADDHSLMSQLVDYAKAINAGDIDDPSFSGFIYEIPEDADVYDEATWKLANPALDDFRSLEDMRDLADKAKKIPTLEATFRNLFCNQRVNAEERWLPGIEWKACLIDDDQIDYADLALESCYGGLDLGSVRDLTSFALYWPLSGILRVWVWCPMDNLKLREETDRVPYTVWANAGLIHPTPGSATNKRAVALKIAEICGEFNPVKIGYDRWGITELENVIDEEGLILPEFEPFGQGYQSMSPATKAFEERVVNRELKTPRNDLLTWAVSNVAISRDAADNKKPNKEKSRERIDPVVASIMAVGLAAKESDGYVDYKGIQSVSA